MKLLSSPENPILTLERFNGFESYSIETAEWNLYKDKDNGMMSLWISWKAGEAIKQLKDTNARNNSKKAYCQKRLCKIRLIPSISLIRS